MIRRLFCTVMILLLAILSGCDGQATTVKPVSSETASLLMQKVQNDEWLLIDVRSPEEFAEGHIPGAINMPHSEIESYVSQLDKDQRIIVYCHSGRRAMLTLETLKSRSFTDVSHLEGDMMGWNAAGLPVDRM